MASNNKTKKPGICLAIYNYLAGRAYSVILLAALLYNIGYKLLWADKLDLISQFHKWILTDIAFIAGVEIVFMLVCWLWPKRRVIRTVTFIAALICTWSVINAAWLRRTGTQVLPNVLLPLFRYPVNAFTIVGHDLKMMPVSAIILLSCAGLLLAFYFSVLIKPQKAKYNRNVIILRVILSCIIVFSTSFARYLTKQHNPNRMVAAGLRSNCQLRAMVSLFSSKSGRLSRRDFANAQRIIPRYDEIEIKNSSDSIAKNNVVLIVLEGVQRQYTSLADKQSNRTPFLASLAKNGIEFTNARATVTHTTKALFSILTGRYPSVSQDIAEAVPAGSPYVSLATILKKLGYSSAFFQSAKGNFETRSALAHNLGFEKFYTREDLPDDSGFIGSLGCDEFEFLKPMTDWIDSQQKPFLLVFMCSITHDPYLVPDWFEKPAQETIDGYFQTIRYTDKFISALHIELEKRNLLDNTVFCVMSDHGEAFGEHGLYGHERIAYDEAMHIPAVISSPQLVTEAVKITSPASSIDFAPVLLSLLGIDISNFGFNGKNVLKESVAGRKVYFTSWLEQSPVGFVQDNKKFIYNPANKSALSFDLEKDPHELQAQPLAGKQAELLRDELAKWRKDTLYKLPVQSGKELLFDRWKCRWTGRFSSAKYKRKK